MAVLVGTATVSPLSAADEIFLSDAMLERVWSEGVFTEGPAQGPDGCIYFSDIGNRIMKFDPVARTTTVHRRPSGGSNGLDFDPQGRLVAAEGAGRRGNRRISITERDGTVRTLADRWQGKRLNGPNDLTVDAKGRVYFTDPRHGSNRTGGDYVPAGAPEEVSTNGTFGGADRRTLYITAGKSLYRLRTAVEGFAVFWPASN